MKKPNETLSRQRTHWERDRGRSVAEWVSLGISVAVLLGLAGLVLYAYLARDARPVVIEVRPQMQSVRHEAGVYYVPVDVANIGDDTAQDVWVRLSIPSPEGGDEATELTIPLLAGGETEQAVVVFRQDPTQAELKTSISYFKP